MQSLKISAHFGKQRGTRTKEILIETNEELTLANNEILSISEVCLSVQLHEYIVAPFQNEIGVSDASLVHRQLKTVEPHVD